MKLLVMQVIKAILGDEIDMKKVDKITSDAKYESGDVKASVAGIRYIISSAAKHNVDEGTLSSELQQLGLPKEHTVALCKTYEGKLPNLKEQFRKESFRKSGHLKQVTWKVNKMQSSGENDNCITLEMNMQSALGMPQDKTFRISPNKLRVLLHELRTAQGLMESD